MSRDEKQLWTLLLVLLGAGLLFFLGGAIGSGWDNTALRSGFQAFTTLFSISFSAWLFRITFLAGRRHR